MLSNVKKWFWFDDGTESAECGLGKSTIMIRIVSLFTVLVLFPFVVLSGIISYNFLQYSMREAVDRKQKAMTRIVGNVSEIVGRYEELSMMVYYDGIVDMLSETDGVTEKQKSDMRSLLSSITYTNDSVTGVSIRFQDEIISGGHEYFTVTSLVDEHLKEIEEAKGKPVWFSSNELFGQEKENRFVMARELNNTFGEGIAVLWMLIDGSRLRSELQSGQGLHDVNYLVSETGRILYSDGEETLNSQMEDDISDVRTGRTMRAGKPVWIVSKIVPKVGWHCISIISESSYRKEILILELPFLAVAILYLLFLLRMLHAMNRYIFRPLAVLDRAMEEYARAGLSAVHISINDKGEFRRMAVHFSNMTERIEDLMFAYKQAEDEKNRQKLRTMAAQLTPHFMYNALNTIRWLAVLNQQENIRVLTEALIAVCMNAAQAEDETYSLSDELHLIESYVKIQKARFMNFELEVDVPEEANNLHVRKLFLQPVVENAIIHGLSRGKVKGTKVLIRARMEDSLYIDVIDEGVGFDVEKWRQEVSPKNKEHTNIGLKNVEEMLQLEYGEGYGLTIESSPGRGTTVHYKIPIIPVKERKRT